MRKFPDVAIFGLVPEPNEELFIAQIIDYSPGLAASALEAM